MKTNVLRRSLVVGIASLLLFGCYREAAPNATSTSPEQKLVDRAATAVTRMRASGNFDGMEYFFEHARGVLVFPRLIKASFIFGGEGGNGVLLAKKSDGSWSAPAFYSLGSGSAGFQLGYQEATVVLFFMNDAALMSAINKGLTLGADASIAAGTIGKSGDATSTTTSKDLYQFSDVGGLFAGVSLDGTVVAARPKFNQSLLRSERDDRWHRDSRAVRRSRRRLAPGRAGTAALMRPHCRIRGAGAIRTAPHEPAGAHTRLRRGAPQPAGGPRRTDAR